jgi:hypothetical protein
MLAPLSVIWPLRGGVRPVMEAMWTG